MNALQAAELQSFVAWQEREAFFEKCMARSMRWAVVYGFSTFRQIRRAAGELFFLRYGDNPVESPEACRLCGHRCHDNGCVFPGCACPY